MVEPSPSSLRDATSPERGRFICADQKIQKAPPLGGAGCDHREQTERVDSPKGTPLSCVGNFAAMPKAPSPRGLSAQQTGGVSCSEPSPSSLRDATFPERGRFICADRKIQKAPPSGELANAVSLRGFVLRQATSPSPSLLRKSTSPKGRGLGKKMKFAGTAKGSPFGRAGKPDRA